MKIGIITQPLQSNYGGIIQNWAMQQALKKIGHEPITIDALPRNLTYRHFIKHNLLSLIALFMPRRKRPFFRLYKFRPKLFDAFVSKNITTTRIVRNYSTAILKEYGIEALLVGSDQVWRPRYNLGCEMEPFFRFAKNINCIKASYAASFGTDECEYSLAQIEECKKLFRQFTAVSVREESGIGLCRDNFGVEAVQVIDPTLLLEKDDYLQLIKNTSPIHKGKFLACYLLDITSEIREIVYRKAIDLKLEPVIITADSEADLTIEEWISIFRDSEYIFTNSFHGCVFSIIFEKPFDFVKSVERGSTRFTLIQDMIDNHDIFKRKEFSFEYLKNTYGKS